jgi:phenylacetic acid degradation operon negative regulatory protein
VKPRSIVFDLFGDHLRYSGGEARMQALGELLEVFGVGESTTRVVLSRMRKEGWFDTRRDGRQTVYSLTEKSWRLLDEGRTRIFERAPDDWDGAWRMVIYAVPEEARAERVQLRRTLAWHGFGPLAAATWVSPHPRLDDVEAALADSSAPRLDLLTCRSRGQEHDREMATRCWDLDGLCRDYAELVSRYDELPSAAELATLPGPEALRLRVELVASYRTFPFRDPDLPPELLPEGWPGRRAHELFVAAHDALATSADSYVHSVLERHDP